MHDDQLQNNKNASTQAAKCVETEVVGAVTSLQYARVRQNHLKVPFLVC